MTPDFDFALGETADMIRDTTQRFATDKIMPLAAKIDAEDWFPRELWPAMGELGLHGITVEEEYGGLGLGYLEHVIACEEVSRASASIGLAALPLRSAWAIATARNVYRQIGVEVKRRGPRAWDKRVGTSKATKLRLLALGGLQALASRFGSSRELPVRRGLWQRPGRADPATGSAGPATAV